MLTLYNLLNEFDFHVNKVAINQAAWNNKRMLWLIPSALTLSTCDLSLPQVISSHQIEQPDHSMHWDRGWIPNQGFNLEFSTSLYITKFKHFSKTCISQHTCEKKRHKNIDPEDLKVPWKTNIFLHYSNYAKIIWELTCLSLPSTAHLYFPVTCCPLLLPTPTKNTERRKAFAMVSEWNSICLGLGSNSTMDVGFHWGEPASKKLGWPALSPGFAIQSFTGEALGSPPVGSLAPYPIFIRARQVSERDLRN